MVNKYVSDFPSLIVEWDFEKNNPLDPAEISYGSNKKVYWTCPIGHSYQSAISNRCRLSRGCPVCAGKRTLPGVNDLKTINPDLAAQWDFDRNDSLAPDMVAPKSHRKVFWLCPEGHSYESAISNRSAGKGCPVCVGRKLVVGINDLATTRPDLAAEWDVHLNSPLSPQDITAGVRKKIFWRCPKGHSYESLVFNRAMGNGCPVCDNKILLAGFNDLATVNPELATEWDSERNYPLTPAGVLSSVKLTAFWLCVQGHSYESTINDRSTGNGCPICAGKQVVAGINDLETVNPHLASEWDYEKNYPLTPKDVSVSAKKKIYWRCPEGHSYDSRLYSRTAGSACPICAETGYDPSQAGLFYFIENKTLNARKVGITNPDRKYDRLSHFGSDWQIVQTVRNIDGELIRKLETSVLKWIRKDLKLPAYLGKSDMGAAGGFSETFTAEEPSNEEVLNFINKTYSSLCIDILKSNQSLSEGKKFIL